MIVDISNGKLAAQINTKGAELCSVIGLDESIQYIWQGDERYWSRSSPVLFPIVGKLKDSKYRYGSKEYFMNQHGFARDSEFALESHSQDTAVFALKSSAESLKIYPFNFKLTIAYKLCDKTIEVSWNVENIDEKEISFSIGAHPGFNCPLDPALSFEDYRLVFENQESAFREFLVDGIRAKKETFIIEEPLSLTRELFEDDALVLSNIKSHKITLESAKSLRKVTLRFEGFPYLGIWSKGDGDFVCIEPWHGIADDENACGDFVEKQGIMKLEPKEFFACSYLIECD